MLKAKRQMRGLDPYKRQLKRWISSLTYDVSVITIAAQHGQVRLPLPMPPDAISNAEITAMLRLWSDGEEQASEDLIRTVYDELSRQARRQLRRERQDHTLDTAALINEAYIKLVDQRSVRWRDRGHFFGLAAELMRRVLVDHARFRQRDKRRDGNDTIALEDLYANAVPVTQAFNVDLIALDDALMRLAARDARQVKIVELRYFAGLDVRQTAEILEISTATVKREWAAAKGWLRYELTRKAHD
jgi:RNA polymerase sigma factor (TIGR02999 family)